MHESDHEGKRASVWYASYNKLQKHFMKDMGSGNRNTKKTEEERGKTVWLKIATRFFVQKEKAKVFRIF